MSGAQGAEPMGSRTATTYESVEGGQNKTKLDIIKENSRNVKNMNRLGGNDIGSVNKGKQITEVVKTVGDAWERLPVLQNLRSKGFSTLTCMVKNCGPQILNCLLDPNCRKALQCLNQCSPVDQKHNCLELDAKIPEKPYVPPMTSFRRKELCHDTAEDLFVGWLGELDWSRRDVAGQNPAYDQFQWKLVWRRRRYLVKRGKIPATFRFSVLDNGVVSNEFWIIVDVSDDLSWGLFHYNGAARVVGQSYTGGCARDTGWFLPGREGKGEIEVCIGEMWD
ncbi:unnamed protein product [Arabidopsis arenosa]|uniref:VDE lipocalin domain-containing protein n=1 Tax=Arabidopsis arenosa TaxID=38785 RepID=A0A8S2A375_ARAAE|nr:unnamed protein product [Arabidopsis arenosa]